MLCDSCSLQQICKLFDFIGKNDLEKKINIDNCVFYSPAPVDFEPGTIEGETREEGVLTPDDEIEETTAEDVVETIERPISESLIVTHGDLDGVLSAIALIRKEGLHGIKTVFTTPADVNNVFNLVNTDEYNHVYVCDIAPNNKNFYRTSEFIERLGDKLVIWYDHHNGWDIFKTKYMKFNLDLPELGFFINEDAKSCAELITEDPFIVGMARTADTGGMNFENELGYILNTAIKDNSRDYSIKYNALKFLLLYLKEGDEARNTIMFASLKRRSEHYSLRISNTEKVILGGEVKGNTYVMHSYRDEIDFTHALMEGYKKAPFAIILTRRAVGTECGACRTIAPPITPEGTCGVCGSKLIEPHVEENIIVGTITRINLLRIFDLESGQPYRVTLRGNNIDKIVEMLDQINV